MTRIALLADIHGNFPALEQVARDMQSFAPDHVVVAGDLVNWAPFSVEVLQFVTEQRWTIVRGNHEFYAINALPPRRPAHWDWLTLPPWLRDQLGDWLPFVASMADDATLLYPDAPDVHLCHGVPGDNRRGVYSAAYNSDADVCAWTAEARAKTIWCGHTHIALDRRIGDLHIVNPGSVGVPLLGELVAEYAILEGDSAGWRVLEQRRLPLDTQPVLDALEQSDFVERCGPTALGVIEEFRHGRSFVFPFNAWMRQHFPDEPQTAARFAQFMQLDHTPYLPQPIRDHLRR